MPTSENVIFWSHGLARSQPAIAAQKETFCGSGALSRELISRTKKLKDKSSVKSKQIHKEADKFSFILLSAILYT